MNGNEENKMSHYKAPPAEMKELTRGVYAFLQAPGTAVSNAGLIVGKRDAMVVDSLDNKYMVENFISKIKEVTDKPIHLVVNTHVHPDHTHTNHYFPEAKVITSHINRKEMVHYTPERVERLTRIYPGQICHEGSKITLQDMTFEGTLCLYDGEREIRIIDMGVGHSQSDVIVYLPQEKVLFAGDLLAVGMQPRGVEKIWGGSYRIIKVLDTLASMDVETFVPGHGMLVLSREETASMIYEFIEFYMVLRGEAHNCFEKGMTYDEAFEKLDWSKFKKWGKKEELKVVRGNLARAFSEFRGEPLGIKIDFQRRGDEVTLLRPGANSGDTDLQKA